MVKFVKCCKTPCKYATLVFARSFMMKYIIYAINCLLIMAIPAMIITGTKKDVKRISTEIDVKKVNSLNLSVIKEFTEQILPTETLETKTEEKEETVEQEDEPVLVSTPVEESQTEIEEEVNEEKVENDILETMVGSMSGYGPDCRGCTGFTSSGYNVNNGIYYSDKTYGEVRILAADRSLKLGSIVRIKEAKLGEIIGIVLDRGSAIGIGKTYLFDLLFASESEAYHYGVSNDVIFEVLRYGY